MMRHYEHKESFHYHDTGLARLDLWPDNLIVLQLFLSDFGCRGLF